MSVQHNRARDVDAGRAWLVLVAVYLVVILQCTILYMNGLYLAMIVEYYNEDLSKTSMIGALNSSLLCLLAPVVSVVIDTYSCRTCIVSGGFLLSISYFISFFFRSVNVFIFSIGIIGGIGNSFVAIPPALLLAYHFDKWRNIFISFKEVLVGFGVFAASPVLLWLIGLFGINGSFLVVSGLALQIIICGLLCAPNSGEMKLWKTKGSDWSQQRESNSRLFLKKVKLSTLLSLSLCKNVSMILFLFSTTSWNMILSAVTSHLPRYILTKSPDDISVVTVMTTFGLCNTLGRFCAATTVGNGGLDSYILHTGMIGILSIVTILFPVYEGLSVAGYLVAGLCGFYTGGPNALMVPITIGLVGVEKLSSAYGLLFFFCGIGVFAGPPLLGAVFEVTGSYNYGFVTMGVVAVLGTLLSLIAFRGKHSDNTQKQEIEVSMDGDAASTSLLEVNEMKGTVESTIGSEA